MSPHWPKAFRANRISRSAARRFPNSRCTSLEIWADETLIGGVYGVTLGGAFFGESMFSRRVDASKIALAYLVDRLRVAGFSLFDTQFITPHLASLGAIEIPRGHYHLLLERALDNEADFTDPPLPRSVHEVLKRNTQTS